MGRKREWDDVLAAEVMRLLRLGYRYREVAERLGVSLGKVQRIVEVVRGG